MFNRSQTATAEGHEPVATATPAPDQLIPLSHLVLEGFMDTVNKLAVRLGDDVHLDDLGRRCTTRDVARRLFDQRAKREATQRAEAAARRAAAKRPVYGRPLPPNATPDMPALAVMKAGDPDHEERLDLAAERLNDYMNGGGGRRFKIPAAE